MYAVIRSFDAEIIALPVFFLLDALFKFVFCEIEPVDGLLHPLGELVVFQPDIKAVKPVCLQNIRVKIIGSKQIRRCPHTEIVPLEAHFTVPVQFERHKPADLRIQIPLPELRGICLRVHFPHCMDGVKLVSARRMNARSQKHDLARRRGLECMFRIPGCDRPVLLFRFFAVYLIEDLRYMAARLIPVLELRMKFRFRHRHTADHVREPNERYFALNDLPVCIQVIVPAVPVDQEIIGILFIRLKSAHIFRISENDDSPPCFFVPDEFIQRRERCFNRSRPHFPGAYSEETAPVCCIHQHLKLVITVQGPMR